MTVALYLLTNGLFAAVILAVFGMKYWSAASQARARLANDNAYSELAKQALALQSASGAAASALESKLAAMGERLVSIEKMLVEVG